MIKINKIYSLILGVLAVLAIIASILVITKLDPYEKTLNIILFYASTGIFVISSSAFILYFFRQRFGVRELAQQHFYVSIRQGIWIGLLYGAGVFLQSQGLFTWLTSVFLVAALTFLEGYFLYKERQ